MDENGGYSIFIPQVPPLNTIRTVVKYSSTGFDLEYPAMASYIDAQISATLNDGISYLNNIELRSMYEIDGSIIFVYDLTADLYTSIETLAQIN